MRIRTDLSEIGPGARALALGRVVLVLLLLATLAAGLFARLDGFGDRPLAIDEYYQVRSVQFILERGLPEYPSGGYYTRAPVLQYLMAGSARLFGESEFSYRLPALIFSLLAIVLTYVYARRFTGVLVAATIAGALLVSSWHVEFARFARMYSLFQFTTLAYLIAIDRAFFCGHWRERYLPHALLVLNTFSQALGILLAPLLFLPLLLDPARAPFRNVWERAGFALAGLATVVFCYGLFSSGAGDAGVTDSMPADYQAQPGLDSPFVTPAFPFWTAGGGALDTLVVVLALAALSAGILLAMKRFGFAVRSTDLLLPALVLLSLAHLFTLCLVIVLVLVLRYDLHRTELHPKRTYVLLLAAALIGAGWVAVALSAPEMLRIPAVTLRWDLGSAGLLKSLWTTFLGWPDFYRGTIRPFVTELPVLGLLAFLALAYALVAHRHDSLPDLLRHPALVLLMTIATFGVLEVPWSVLRYWFHLYPVILCLIAVVTLDMARRVIGSDRRLADVVAAFAFLGAFALTSDLNVTHLSRAGSEAVSYRTGPFERFETTWYPRMDVATPAQFVNQTVVPRERNRIIVENLPPSSYYLEVPHAIYYVREGARFRLVSRERGTRDRWSDMRLMSTPEEMAAYTGDADEVWLIRETKRFELLPEPKDVWGERLIKQSRAFVSRDGRVEVLHIELAPQVEDGAAFEPDARDGLLEGAP